MTHDREGRGTGASIGRPPVLKIVAAPVAILALLSSVVLLVNTVSSYSFFLGGLVAVLPQMYFAVRVFSFAGASSAKQIARSSYAGEIGKFVLSVAGFAAIFAGVRPLHSEAVFLGFILTMIVQYTGMWVLLRPTKGEKKESIHGS